MRLRAGLRVLRRTATEVQLGTDPRWAVRLTDLTPSEADVLQLIDARTDLTRLADLTSRHDVDPDRLRALVEVMVADRHETDPQGQRHRRAEDEAAGLHAEHLVDDRATVDIASRRREGVDDRRQRRVVGEERGDVLEEDPGLGEVGDVGDQREGRVEPGHRHFLPRFDFDCRVGC